MLDLLDPRIDRVRDEAEPLADLDTGGKRPHMDRVTTAGQLGQQCADRQ